ncbi:MAG: hypothetical protein Q9222_004969 [Ikaeria aurantiellina]
MVKRELSAEQKPDPADQKDLRQNLDSYEMLCKLRVHLIIMFDEACVKAFIYESVRYRLLFLLDMCVDSIDRIPRYHPQDWREDFVHPLAVASVWVELTVNEKNIKKHKLSGWLSEVEVLRHASFDILEDFGTQFFVMS